MSEFDEIFCPFCGDKVALFDIDKGRFEDREYFLTHLREAHGFTSTFASALVSFLEYSFGGGVGD